MERLTIVILLIAGLLTPAWVTAGPLQISLRAETTMQGDTIFLSHLLPPHVPEHIRNLAGNISLGAAPEPGKLRLLHAPFILSRLQANDLDPGFFTIPDTAIIHRGHLITKQQVLRAIRTAVRQRGGAVSNELDENEIELSTVVFTAQQNPRLAVDDIVAPATEYHLVSDASCRAATHSRLFCFLSHIAGQRDIQRTDPWRAEAAPAFAYSPRSGNNTAPRRAFASSFHELLGAVRSPPTTVWEDGRGCSCAASRQWSNPYRKSSGPTHWMPASRREFRMKIICATLSLLAGFAIIPAICWSGPLPKHAKAPAASSVYDDYLAHVRAMNTALPATAGSLWSNQGHFRFLPQTTKPGIPATWWSSTWLTISLQLPMEKITSRENSPCSLQLPVCLANWRPTIVCRIW